MKTINIISASIACFLLCACQGENHITDKGNEISFKIATELYNGPATRTEYSGQTFTVEGNSYERINWLEGDPVTIYTGYGETSTGSHYANYTVSSVSNNEFVSEASVTSQTPLHWTSQVDIFYALYPSPGSEGSDPGLSFDCSHEGRFITAVIPSDQSDISMKYAYMYASAAETAFESESVSLSFKPLVNTLHFSLYSETQTEARLKSLSLHSGERPLAGSFRTELSYPSANLPGYTIRSVTDASQTITATFDGDGIELPVAGSGSSPFEYTLFTIPTDISELTVTATFTKDSGEETRTLELKDATDWITLPAAYKLNINSTIPTSDIFIPTIDPPTPPDPPDPSVTYYTLGNINNIYLSGNEAVNGATKSISVISYKQTDDVIEGVPWNAYVLGEDGSTWLSENDEGWPSWLALSSSEGTGSASGENRTITISPSTYDTYSITDNSNVNMVSTLKNRSVVGSDSSPRDLSLYDIYGNAYVTGSNQVHSITQAGSHTSNCYVISAPGYYCFPLVYGNAIDATRGSSIGEFGGKVYSSAYLSHNTNTGAYINADGQGIGSPYILSDPNLTSKTGNYNAIVVWQDVYPGFEIIKSGRCEVIDAPPGAGLSCNYIKFYIDEADILPGNIMIALRDTDNENKILWSWHIWVTDVPSESIIDDFHITNVLYRTANITDVPTTSIDILNCNLGWTPPLVYKISTSERTARIKIVQNDGDAEVADPVIFNVLQYDQTYTASESLEYSNTRYQWGRKDPFLPLTGYHNQERGYSTAESNYVITTNQNNDLGITDLNSISNPYIAKYTSSVLRQDAWNSNYNTGNSTVSKTVYDPCPAGFCIPHSRSFTGFTTDGNSLNLLMAAYFPGNQLCGGTLASNYTYNKRAHGRFFSNRAVTNQDTFVLFFPQNRSNSEAWIMTASSTIYFYNGVSLVDPMHKNQSSNTLYDVRPALEE